MQEEMSNKANEHTRCLSLQTALQIVVSSSSFVFLINSSLIVALFLSQPQTTTTLMASGNGGPLPKFGEWDVNNPASAEGFTVIFNKARDEKKTTATPHRSDPGLKNESCKNAEYSTKVNFHYLGFGLASGFAAAEPRRGYDALMILFDVNHVFSNQVILIDEVGLQMCPLVANSDIPRFIIPLAKVKKKINHNHFKPN
ncbi:unnamed protein product [Sphenostylis stenocarpa]|uniref:RIN4 pathogenic type III effector avirulence factor Avr cleavage site domain-containing protein n=1 Tax=Sphenostylis stenocarpa TaxID=92480 RepID=A0AA86SLB1_9FABA|nr:unnamed protein product [Sphenostylis stenocarpa]